MTEPFIDQVVQRAYVARAALAADPRVAPFVDLGLDIPKPYLGSGEIRLVIIGQDPTVQNPRTRAHIKMVLTLDRNGHLRRYLSCLCADLGLSLAENVYATNACKCFFTDPPTTLMKERQVDVLQAGAEAWLPLLRWELEAFPAAAVISLGEPVLGMLVWPGASRSMRDYWGYHVRWREGQSTPMHAIEARESAVGRAIYPFAHQPTLHAQRAAFYRQRWAEYTAWIRRDMSR